MSTWEPGRTYDYYGEPLVCSRRWFVGAVEMVGLHWPLAAGQRAEDVEFIRCARTLAPCVVPFVTETLGGVTRADACDHRGYGRVTANAGPHSGERCCSACGTPAGGAS